MSRFGRIRARVVAIVATVSVLSFLVTGVYWVWNTRQRPSAISGVWLLDDLRTQGDDASLVTFSTSGVFDSDPDFGARWRYRNGRIYLRTWRIDGQSQFLSAMQDTTLYSWFADAQEFSLGVELSEDGKLMTLTADGEGPRCRLRRVVR